jgi:hypothetical protein
MRTLEPSGDFLVPCLSAILLLLLPACTLPVW